MEEGNGMTYELMHFIESYDNLFIVDFVDYTVSCATPFTPGMVMPITLV